MDREERFRNIWKFESADLVICCVWLFAGDEEELSEA